MAEAFNQQPRSDRVHQDHPISKRPARIDELAPLLEQLAGHLASRYTDPAPNGTPRPLIFTFRWQELSFTGRVLAAPVSHVHELELIAHLGPVAYSSENISRRRKMLGILEPLVSRGEITITRHGQAQMITRTNFEDDRRTTRRAAPLMTAIAVTLLDIRPTLDNIARAFA